MNIRLLFLVLNVDPSKKNPSVQILLSILNQPFNKKGKSIIFFSYKSSNEEVLTPWHKCHSSSRLWSTPPRAKRQLYSRWLDATHFYRYKTSWKNSINGNRWIRFEGNFWHSGTYFLREGFTWKVIFWNLLQQFIQFHHLTVDHLLSVLVTLIGWGSREISLETSKCSNLLSG